ncbi:MAG: hypothetical protein JSR65_14010 [Proteobacteria bacterium]|nr:hypothetical protein [Pseudomonadota bacterium]
MAGTRDQKTKRGIDVAAAADQGQAEFGVPRARQRRVASDEIIEMGSVVTVRAIRPGKPPVGSLHTSTEEERKKAKGETAKAHGWDVLEMTMILDEPDDGF